MYCIKVIFFKLNYIAKVVDAKSIKEKVYDDEKAYDKIQVAVKEIHLTLKEFKIKNKNQFIELAQQEEILTRELELLESKFDALLDEEKNIAI